MPRSLDQCWLRRRIRNKLLRVPQGQVGDGQFRVIPRHDLPQSQLPQGQHLPRLLEFLASSNKAKNIVASTILTELGPQVVHTLIIEAMTKRRGPTQVVRFLDVVEAIGAPLSLNDFFSVGALMRSPHAIVRESIARLMINLRPHNIRWS